LYIYVYTFHSFSTETLSSHPEDDITPDVRQMLLVLQVSIWLIKKIDIKF